MPADDRQTPQPPDAAHTRAPDEPPRIHRPLKPTPDEFFIHHDPVKWDEVVAEMRWDQLRGRGYLVSNDRFFVMSWGEAPRIDVATWRLKIEGSGVERALELTYDELLRLPSVSVTCFIECAGNGRVFFKEELGRESDSWPRWRLGGYGVAEWTGVPLRDVLALAGLKKTARDVMPEGLDAPRVQRPMPVEKALEADTLLAYAMNGQPLPPDHGFPVRVVVPGWIGNQSIKWVGRIEVSESPIYSYFNTEEYVMIGPEYPPEDRRPGPALSHQSVKSALELAWPAEIGAGHQLVRGRSWSPFGAIARVQYSLDRGATWRDARLRQPNIPRAGVRWDFEWDARPGEHTIRVRATDDAGNAQPDRVPWNEKGYLYSGVVGHPVRVV